MRTLVHGTAASYTNLACRCAECREAIRKARAHYMATHPEQRRKHRLRERLRYRRQREEQLQVEVEREELRSWSA